MENSNFFKFLLVVLVVVALNVITTYAQNGEYDRMHPQLHIRRSRAVGRSKREMPTLGFEPLPMEDDEDFWNNVGQEILKEQLDKNRLNTHVAKNVILFLGDGMSIPTITAARVYKGGEEQQLSFEKFPYVGLSKTYCANTQVADSACSATAYLGGVKANYGTIGVSAKVNLNDCVGQNRSINHVESIARWAQHYGMATGLITTTKVTHASPAGVYAHTSNRNWENDRELKKDGGDPNVCMDIAKQLVYGPVGHKLHVIMGGGRQEFLPEWHTDIEGNKGLRTDDADLIDIWKLKHRKHKPSYVQNRDELMNMPKSTDYLLGLFASDHMPYHLDADNRTYPTLSEMLIKALDVLEKHQQGYFLFVEGGRIDHAHHDTEAIKAIDETSEFEKAVDIARKKTSEQNTLIVVTADHSHTMSVSGYSSRKNDIFGVSNSQFGLDDLPYATLSYANGPGFDNNMKTKNGIRRNLFEVNMHDKEYKFPSTVPLDSETHGGDDVPVYASGPWAHLFTGTYEQNFIPHAMAYAACIGNGLTSCSDR